MIKKCCDDESIHSVIGVVVLETLNGERFRVYSADADRCRSCGFVHSLWGEASEDVANVRRDIKELNKAWEEYDLKGKQGVVKTIHLNVTKELLENKKGVK